jgi:hypothetical protein
LLDPLCQLSPSLCNTQASLICALHVKPALSCLSTPSARLCSYVHFPAFSFFTAHILSRHYSRPIHHSFT